MKALKMNLDFDVLIVDDNSDNIKVTMNILQENNYNFSFALSGEQALDIIQEKRFDIILLDVMMPHIDGFTVLEKIKKNPLVKDVPVIMLTAKTDIDSITKAFKYGAVDYITKPFHAAELLARVSSHLELYYIKKVLVKKNIDLRIKMKDSNERLLTELEAGQKELIHILTELIESTSDETGEHIKRVAIISRLLAQLHHSLTSEDEMTIYDAAPMHDIGKVAIPYEILSKPTALTKEEFAIVKKHTVVAYESLKNSQRKLLQAGAVIAHEHHEYWNGEGYPRGLQGEEIHLYARIVAMADVLDSLLHKRSYKEAWDFNEAAQYIIDRKGEQFDPYIVECFEKNLEQFRTIFE